MLAEHDQTEKLKERFPIALEIPVLWGDQDAMGHVNNTVPLRWFETARVMYLQRLGFDQFQNGVRLAGILAATHCNYRCQVRYPDTIIAATRVQRVGRTSIVMENCIYSHAADAIAVDGEAVVVVFDYLAQSPVPVPESIRSAIEQLERTTLAR